MSVPARVRILVLPTDEEHRVLVADFISRCILAFHHAPYDPPKSEVLEKCAIGVAYAFHDRVELDTARELGAVLHPPPTVDIVGYLAMAFHSTARVHSSSSLGTGYVISLVVSQGWRRKGIASRLLAHMVEYARKRRGVSRFTLHVMRESIDAEPAREFYTAAGFRVNRLLHDYYGPEKHAQGMILEESKGRPQKRCRSQ